MEKTVEQKLTELERKINELQTQVNTLKSKTTPNEICKIIDTHMRQQGMQHGF